MVLIREGFKKVFKESVRTLFLLKKIRLLGVKPKSVKIGPKAVVKCQASSLLKRQETLALGRVGGEPYNL